MGYFQSRTVNLPEGSNIHIQTKKCQNWVPLFYSMVNTVYLTFIPSHLWSIRLNGLTHPHIHSRQFPRGAPSRPTCQFGSPQRCHLGSPMYMMYMSGALAYMYKYIYICMYIYNYIYIDNLYNLYM
jgi:hypothetical protein